MNCDIVATTHSSRGLLVCLALQLTANAHVELAGAVSGYAKQYSRGLKFDSS